MQTTFRSTLLWCAMFASPGRRSMKVFFSILPQRVPRHAVMAVWGMAVFLLLTASVGVANVLEQKIVGFTADTKGSLTLNLMTGTTLRSTWDPTRDDRERPWLNKFLSGHLDLPKVESVEAAAATMGVKRTVNNDKYYAKRNEYYNDGQ